MCLLFCFLHKLQLEVHRSDSWYHENYFEVLISCLHVNPEMSFISNFQSANKFSKLVGYGLTLGSWQMTHRWRNRQPLGAQ